MSCPLPASCPSTSAISGNPPKDMAVTSALVKKNLASCQTSAIQVTVNDLNIIGGLTVGGLPFVGDYNQIQARSGLPSNSFAVVKLPGEEANVRQGDDRVAPAGPTPWIVFGDYMECTPAVGVPVPRPFVIWNNVFVPYTGTYELHFSTFISNIPGPSPLGVTAGTVDGATQTPVDFSIVYVGDLNFMQDAVLPLGIMASGVHDIGVINVGPGSNGGLNETAILGPLRLVQVA